MLNILLTGDFSGISVILITLIFGTILFIFSFIIASRIDKKFVPHIITGITVGILMAIMSMNSKIVSIELNGYMFPLVLSSLFFPVLALSSDVLNEFWGIKHAKALLNCAIITQFMMWILTFWFAEIPAISAENHETYKNTFLLAWRAFFAGGISMYITNIVDIYVFDYLRKLTKGEKLWSRVFGSTAINLLLDIVIYTSIVFIGVESFSVILKMMFISAMVRLTFSAIEVPALYLIKWLNKKQIFLVDSEEST